MTMLSEESLWSWPPLIDRAPLVQFVIPGEAVPFARTGSRGKQRYTLDKQRNYMQLAKGCAWDAMNSRAPLDGPVAMSVHAQFLHPKSWSKKRKQAYWKGTMSDTSNIVKLLEDAMNRIVFNDDAQISLLYAQKNYAPIAQTIVTVWSLEP